MELVENSSVTYRPLSDATMASYVAGETVDRELLVYIEIAFLILVGIVGSVGNATLVLVVLVNADMRNVPNTLIASLALGDLMFLLINVPYTVSHFLGHTYTGENGYENFICRFQTCISIVSEGVSVLTLAALSYDRYNAIVRPMHRRRSNAVRRTYVLAISIWVISICLSLPATLKAGVRKAMFADYGEVTMCFQLPHGQLFAKVHEMLRGFILYLLPLAAISSFYTIIAMKLMESSRDLPGESRGDATKQVTARRRLAKIVLVLVMLFGICWLPHFLYRILSEFNFNFTFLTNSGVMMLQTISLFLMYTNCSINPIAMCILSKTYRDYFGTYLCYCFPSMRRARPQKYPMTLNSNSVNNTTKYTDHGSERPTSIETKTL